MAIFSPTEITDNYMRGLRGQGRLAGMAAVPAGGGRRRAHRARRGHLRPRPPTAWRTPGSCGSCRGSSSPSAS